MAQRTFVPGLRAALHLTYRYGTRWQVKLEQNLTAPQYECLVEVLSAIAACLVLLGTAPVDP